MGQLDGEDVAVAAVLAALVPRFVEARKEPFLESVSGSNHVFRIESATYILKFMQRTLAKHARIASSNQCSDDCRLDKGIGCQA